MDSFSDPVDRDTRSLPGDGADPGFERLVSLIDLVADGLLPAEGDPVDSDVVAGSSAQAQENRAIHISRARSAAERAVEARERLPEMLRQVRRDLQRVREGRERRASDAARRTMPRALGAAMSQVTGTDDRESTLREVLRGAVAGIPDVDLATVLLTDRRGQVLHGAGSDSPAEALIAEQIRTGEGPCPDVVRTGQPARAADLAADDAGWGVFAPRAVASGVRGVLSLPLPGEFPRGSLAFWSRRPGVFDESTRELAELFARHAALAIAGAERMQAIQRAMGSRDVIGQAKGVLMVRRGVDADEAFRLLVRSSQDTNIKLVDVARWVTENLTTPD